MDSRKTGRFGTLRLLLLVLHIGHAIHGHPSAQPEPQFTNLRIFKSERFNSLARADLSRSSPGRRVTVTHLSQQLTRPEKEASRAPASASEPSLKDSPIRRINMTNGPPVWKQIPTRFAALNKALPTSTPGKSSPPAASVRSSSTSAPPVPTTSSTTTSRPPTSHWKAKASKKPVPARIKNGALAVQQSNLKDLPNSPIYYIKLPSSSYSFVNSPQLNSGESSTKFPHVHLPIEFNVNGKPSSIYLANQTKTTPTSTSTPTSTVPTTAASTVTSTSPTVSSSTTTRPAVTNSRIIYVKGQFNGRPGNVYWHPAPYRPPNYWDFLHSLYPKLKRAQFIR